MARRKGEMIMAIMNRRKWLAAAGTTTVATGASLVLAQDKSANNQRYNFKKLSPRDLIQQRHLPNVELVTQDNQRVPFYTDVDSLIILRNQFDVRQVTLNWLRRIIRESTSTLMWSRTNAWSSSSC